jgi:hypothetical protein
MVEETGLRHTICDELADALIIGLQMPRAGGLRTVTRFKVRLVIDDSCAVRFPRRSSNAGHAGVDGIGDTTGTATL